MITVRGRQLVIPRDENQIGTTYDDNSEVRRFLIDRVTFGGIDLSHLNFRLDLEYQGEKKDTSLLDVEVREDSILLTWTIPHSCLTAAGTVWIAIRGYDDNGTVKWATNKGAVYVEDTIDTPGSNPPGLTELEQLERRIEEKTEMLDANEGERQQNEVIRQENEQRRQNNEAEWQRQAETAIGQANTTLQGANDAKEAAQGSATSAAESATAANASKEAAASSAQEAEESAAEAQRISQGFAGFDGTALSVPAVDVQGLVGQAGSTSNVQAMLDYLAVKVAQELVGNEALTTKLLDYVTKSSIVQTESTDPTTVPSSPYFKKVTDKLTSDLALQPILNVDILTLNTGHYYATNCTNLPPGWVAAYLDVERLDEQWCRITAWPPYEGVESPQIIKCFGGTWGNWISVLTSTNVAFFDVSRIDFLFNPATGESVIKFGVSSTRTDQIVVDDQHIRLDRWDGNTWTNIWTK